MPTRKVSDNVLPIAQTCLSPEHWPAPWRIYSPGTYEHTCPDCGKQTNFVVPPPPHIFPSPQERYMRKLKKEWEEPKSWEGGDPNVTIMWGRPVAAA